MLKLREALPLRPFPKAARFKLCLPSTAYKPQRLGLDAHPLISRVPHGVEANK